MSVNTQNNIEVSIRYFAIVREKLGCDTETVSLASPASVDDLHRELASRHPILDKLRRHLRTAVNMEFVGDDHPLNQGDEIGLIPPVAGGSGRARLLKEPLDPARLGAQVLDDTRGALATFVGVVRNHNKGHAVSYLEYEVYPEMAEAKLEAICREVDEAWPMCAVAVEHRYGRLEIGDAAVVIAVASPHRKQAFLACEHVIERIKEDVPIWKREVGPDGESWVGMGS